MTKTIFPTSVSPLLPDSASALFRELSSAAVDAELARIARNWSLGEIERKIGAFKPARSLAGSRKKSFHALRSGSRLKLGHVMRIQAAFPSSNVYLWWSHPLADVLCNPRLGIDDLAQFLRRLPSGRVRSLVLLSMHIPASGFLSEQIAPWTANLITALNKIGSPTALFALAARLRIEQLTGNQLLGQESACAMWEIFPRAIARSSNLLISKDAITLAMDYFQSWQPFADARFWQMCAEHSSIERSKATRVAERIWRSNTSIPDEIKLARRTRLQGVVVPNDAYPNSWWGRLSWRFENYLTCSTMTAGGVEK